MKKIVKVLNEKEITNEYGVKTIYTLIKEYKQCGETEYDVEYVFEARREKANGEKMIGGTYRTFKRLHNAEQYSEVYFR